MWLIVAEPRISTYFVGEGVLQLHTHFFFLHKINYFMPYNIFFFYVKLHYFSMQSDFIFSCKDVNNLYGISQVFFIKNSIDFLFLTYALKIVCREQISKFTPVTSFIFLCTWTVGPWVTVHSPLPRHFSSMACITFYDTLMI